jgi:hypothetical protein
MTLVQVPEDVVSGSFNIFTSNVDAYFYDYFEDHEIFDCHGTIELWRCSDRYRDSGVCSNFLVDLETLLAPPDVDTKDE